MDNGLKIREINRRKNKVVRPPIQPCPALYSPVCWSASSDSAPRHGGSSSGTCRPAPHRVGLPAWGWCRRPAAGTAVSGSPSSAAPQWCSPSCPRTSPARTRPGAGGDDTAHDLRVVFDAEENLFLREKHWELWELIRYYYCMGGQLSSIHIHQHPFSLTRAGRSWSFNSPSVVSSVPLLPSLALHLNVDDRVWRASSFLNFSSKLWSDFVNLLNLGSSVNPATGHPSRTQRITFTTIHLRCRPDFR